MITSTSSFERHPLRFVLYLVLLTALMLGGYWMVVAKSGWAATTAETNLNAGLLRLQALADSHGKARLLAGSSIIAKLDETLVFDEPGVDRINVGIDGGSAIFAVERILESNAVAEVVLIEANLIMQARNDNMTTLYEASRSSWFNLGAAVPVLRREYRPSTWLYSLLKAFKDNRGSSGDGSSASAEGIRNTNIPVQMPTADNTWPQGYDAIRARWQAALNEFNDRGATVILVMMPDGDEDGRLAYAFARALGNQFALPLIDLKGHLDPSLLRYSDGTHLVGHSAAEVSKLLHDVVSAQATMP